MTVMTFYFCHHLYSGLKEAIISRTSVYRLWANSDQLLPNQKLLLWPRVCILFARSYYKWWQTVSISNLKFLPFYFHLKQSSNWGLNWTTCPVLFWTKINTRKLLFTTLEKHVCCTSSLKYVATCDNHEPWHLPPEWWCMHHHLVIHQFSRMLSCFRDFS